MAAVTRQLFSADGGLATVSYTYDDVSLLITTMHATNTTPFPFFAELLDPTGKVLWSGDVLPQGQTPNPPSTLAPGDYDISAAGVHMVQKTVFGTTQLVPADSASFRWPA